MKATAYSSPTGGQGMNTGMQDTFNLARKLALIQRGEGQAEPVLQSYSIERSTVGEQVLHLPTLPTPPVAPSPTKNP
jgi:2-polyprenyl-6-methoxyphenol hydroxylase-like FAD-dependent oxidoreductase